MSHIPETRAGLRVRVADAADAAAIADIHLDAWRRAYAHLFPPDALAGMALDHREGAWRGLLAADVAMRRVLVAEPPGAAPLGFSAWGPTRDRRADRAGVAELCALYVRPSAWGAGAGRMLLERGLALARADRFSHATLWVVADNPRARRFYEAAGWSPDGARKEESVLGVRIAEVRYAIALRPPEAPVSSPRAGPPRR